MAIEQKLYIHKTEEAHRWEDVEQIITIIINDLIKAPRIIDAKTPESWERYHMAQLKIYETVETLLRLRDLSVKYGIEVEKKIRLEGIPKYEEKK